jgi:hypothetical protein
MWQDIAIAVISIFFNIALAPQIIYSFKTKRKTVAYSTALVTTIGVFISAFIYFTLHLYFTVVTSFISGILWFIIFIQSAKYKK